MLQLINARVNHGNEAKLKGMCWAIAAINPISVNQAAQTNIAVCLSSINVKS